MTAIILQARMGSSRLPGKSMMPLYKNKPALELMLERVKQCRSTSEIVVAIPDTPEDDQIAQLCARLNVKCFRGSHEDVLDRYYQCAVSLKSPDTIVRLTGDCPLHDPRLIDQVVDYFHAHSYDYVSNVHPPTYPNGLDVEVFTFKALEKAWHAGRLPLEREHVTYYIHTHPQLFKLGSVTQATDQSLLRWTLDEERDLKFLREVCARLDSPNFTTEDVIRVVQNCPDIMAINADIQRNACLPKAKKS